MKILNCVLAALSLLCFGTACNPDGNGMKPEESTTPGGQTEPPVVLVTEITLSETSLPLLVGEGATLTATVVPDNAGNKAVSWSSGDEASRKWTETAR